jgi:YcaO-like protein with predicted kinase domain
VHWVEHIRAVVEGRATSGARKLKHQRIKASEQTFADLKPLFRAAGITRVADVTGLDALGIPTVMVARPNSRAISVAQGKGLDIWAARTSGIMEAFESFHAERLDWPVRLLTWREFSGSVGSVDPSELPRPRRRTFDPDVRLPWIEADDLLGGPKAFVPLELVHTAFVKPLPPGSGNFVLSSNGLASGNTYGEAVLHGLCELIERDAIARSTISSPFEPRPIRLEPGINADLDQILDRLQRVGARISVHEITTDLDVSVFQAVITGGSDSAVTSAAAGGLGCHPDRVWACLRAITEAAQSRLTRLVGSRDDLTTAVFAHNRPNAPEAPAIADNARSLLDGPNFCGDTAEDDLRWVVERLRARSYDRVFTVDLSRPEFGIPIVRVLVPRLAHPLSSGERPRMQAAEP